MENSTNETNQLSPEVFYGVFKIQRKNTTEKLIQQFNTNAFASTPNNDCEIITAHDTAFKTEQEAKDLLSILPKPAMYLILPVYLSI
jgi:hypothetical protein